MSSPSGYDDWVESNRADLEQRYCEANEKKFLEWCYDLYVNQMPDGDGRDD